jgi:hypothetical protein
MIKMGISTRLLLPVPPHYKRPLPCSMSRWLCACIAAGNRACTGLSGGSAQDFDALDLLGEDVR